MELNWFRHPFRTLNRVHESLVDQAIDANLRCARDHAARGNYEGFHRHCSHAENLARQHKPERLAEVEQVAAHSVDSIANPPEPSPETAASPANV